MTKKKILKQEYKKRYPSCRFEATLLADKENYLKIK